MYTTTYHNVRTQGEVPHFGVPHFEKLGYGSQDRIRTCDLGISPVVVTLYYTASTISPPDYIPVFPSCQPNLLFNDVKGYQIVWVVSTGFEPVKVLLIALPTSEPYRLLF